MPHTCHTPEWQGANYGYWRVVTALAPGPLSPLATIFGARPKFQAGGPAADAVRPKGSAVGVDEDRQVHGDMPIRCKGPHQTAARL